MQRWVRNGLSGLAVLGLAGGLLAAGTALGAPDEVADAPPAAQEQSSATTPLGQAILDLQDELARVPGKFTAWSELGLAYVQQARLTADPTYYGRAEGAFARSLALRPDGNDAALTGQASLAAARHEFAEALALTDASLEVNGFSPTTYAVRTDALNELGRYEQAQAAAQQLLDLRPGGVDALTRASYVAELQGRVDRARTLLEQAAGGAPAGADVAFAQFYLGELAFNNGDLEAAGQAYEASAQADPDYLPAVAGRAKVLAAQGDPTAAAAEYREVVARLPAAEYLLAYGELLEATGQDAAAEEQYAVLRATSQLAAANGQDVDTELALFEADHGDPAVALASAEKAYAKRPDGIFTQQAYAWALHAAGRDREALPVARASVRLGTKLPSLYYRLGVIEAAAGDATRAKAALTTALQLNPAFDPLRAPRAQALLDRLG